MEYNFNIKLPSPLLKMDVVIDYEEVKLASGIAYILLLFFSESLDRKELLNKKLDGIGVPQRLHFIFSQELTRMCDRSVVSVTNGGIFNESLFDSYSIGDFELTEKGLRLLRNGVMSTGQTKQKKLQVGYSFCGDRINFFTKFGNVIATDNSYVNRFGENESDYVNGLVMPDYESSVIKNNVEVFCENHKSDKEIGFAKKEEIDSVTLQRTEYCFEKIPAVMTIDTERNTFAVTTGNEDYDKYILSYLGSQNVCDAISALNGTDIVRNMIQDDMNSVSLKFSDIPSSRIRNISFEFHPVTDRDGYVFLSDKLVGVELPENNGGSHVFTVKTNLLNEVLMSPLAIAVSSGKEVYGYVPVSDSLSYAVSYGPLKNSVFNYCMVAVCDYEYDEVKSSLLNFLKIILDNDVDSGCSAMLGLFGCFDDVESCCALMEPEAVLSKSRVDYIAKICKKLNGIKSDFAEKVKAEMKEVYWKKIYNYVLQMIRNDDYIKDMIEFFSPKILDIAQCFEIEEKQILRDFRSISGKTNESEQLQYYYFRALGFSEFAVLSEINPLKNLNIFNTCSKGLDTALDNLLSVVKIIKDMENTFNVMIFVTDKKGNRIDWPMDRINAVREQVKELRRAFTSARPLLSIPDEQIITLKKLIERIDSSLQKSSVSVKGKNRKVK